MEEDDSHSGPHRDNDRIKLNVGGRLFESTASSLRSAGPDTLLAALSNQTGRDPNHPVFIDRDPEIFSVLLSLLRTNRLPSSARRFVKQELIDEAAYYGVESYLKSAMSPPPLSGIDASHIATVRPAADALPSTFSAASGDGSVLIAHGGQISAYDWALSHAATIRTHLDDITSVRPVWPDVAAIGSDSAAGLHFYDFSSGRHVSSIQWTDPSDPRIFKARVAAIVDSPTQVFASFECPHRENCVLIVDKSTLRVVSELGRQSGGATKTMVPGKMTWVPETGLLVGSAVSCGAFGYSGYIRLWDPRSQEVVWETNEPGAARSSRFGDSFADMDVDIEGLALFKICSKSGDLGMADMRCLGDDPWVYLRDKNPSMLCAAGEGNALVHCYRKQVFVGRDGSLEVWSSVEKKENGLHEGLYRRNYVDKVQDSERGVIKKIEGGGDRLFLSREDVEGIEVWESSSFSGLISVL